MNYDDLVKEYSERSLTVKYLSNCPEEKSFYVAGECKDCEG
jgi:hypothetical protein